MRRSDFHFALPPDRIAQYPLKNRSASRLLCLDGRGNRQDRRFWELPDLLRPGDLLVFNNTKVLRARFFGRKASGGQVEILLERLLSAREALAQIRASKAPKPGTPLYLAGGEPLRCEGRAGDLFHLRALEEDFSHLMQRQGHMPLPPYIRRPDGPKDEARYQTVYASRAGAVAAPTAGLHFDAALLERLKQRGIGFAQITLHIGAGTFQPVRVENLDEHQMHAEWLEVDETACQQIQAARAAGGRIIAVGTTSVRSLETAAANGTLRPYRGETRLFIRPGYRFRAVDALITNFHLPESTLLMLVCAFGGRESVLAAYAHAVEQGYRFFSYGDAMFLSRRAP